MFGKWSEIFGKSSETSPLVCLYNIQNITCPSVDTNFILLCSTPYLTTERNTQGKIRIHPRACHILSISVFLHHLCYIGSTGRLRTGDTCIRELKQHNGNANVKATKQEVSCAKQWLCRCVVSLCTFQPSPSKQQRETTKFCVFWRRRMTVANVSYFYLKFNAGITY